MTRAPSSPTKVLVVDDEPAVLAVLGVALRQYGFAVHLANGCAEAVAFYEHRGESIVVVLLDVRMPGKDGPQTLAALRERDPAVRCCFMSGDTGKYSVADLLALGATHVFEKPFRSLVHLAQTLRQAAELGAARESEGNRSGAFQ